MFPPMKRRGGPDSPWGNSRPEPWANRIQRGFPPRPTQRGNFHGYNQRPPGPRRWRPDNNFRPRNPTWNGNTFKQPFLRFPNSDHPLPRANTLSANRFPWPDPNQHNSFASLMNPQQPPQMLQRDLYGLKGEENLHETINTVKQKLRERTMSADFQTEPLLDAQTDEMDNYKSSERRRIEHSKTPKRTTAEKRKKRCEGSSSKSKSSNLETSLSDDCKRQAEMMRRKILKQLFRLDKDKLRNLLNQSESSIKYEAALGSLCRERRDAISRDIRHRAEKTLQENAQKHNTSEDRSGVQDEFLGHLGTMLDINATLELSSMEPQIIAELSKVLQEDLMGPLTDETSVRCLANAVTDSVRDEVYGSGYQYNNQDNNISQPEFDGDPAHNNMFAYPFEQYHVHEDVKNEYLPYEGESKYYPGDYESFHGNQYAECVFDADIEQFNRQQSRQDEYFPYNKHESPKSSFKDKSESPKVSSSSQDGSSHPSDSLYSRSSSRCKKKMLRDSESSKLDLPSSVQAGEKASPRRKRGVSFSEKDSGRNELKYKESKKIVPDSEPVSPAEDFRSILPKNSNFKEKIPSERQLDDQLTTPKKDMSEDDNVNGSESDRRTKRKRDDSSVYNVSPKRLAPIDANIAIRKDLFFKSNNNESPQQESERKNDSLISGNQNLVNTPHQTDLLKNTNDQGSQYDIKRCDASCQIYESLFTSRSKGTQTLNENTKDRIIQTLEIVGLSELSLSHGAEHTTDAETQTDGTFKSEPGELKDVETSCNIIDETKTSKNRVLSNVKSENILERMKEIDMDIFELMKEKFGLYNYLKSIDVEPERKTEVLSNTYHIPIIRNKLKSGSDTSKRLDRGSSSRFNDATGKNGRYRDRSHAESGNRSGKHMSNSNSTSGKQKAHASSDSKSHRSSAGQFTRSHSRQKVREDDNPKYDKHKAAPGKRTRSSVTSDNSSKTLAFEIIPNKDISTCSEAGVVNVSSDEHLANISNIHNKILIDSTYLDPSGCPVPVDCEVIVSEEVVINSESDNTALYEEPKPSQDSLEVTSKRSDSRKNRNSRNNSTINKSDSNTGVKKHSKSPHGAGKTAPPIRIKKQVASMCDSQVKSSPLYNLISQMKDSGGDTDEEIANPSSFVKRKDISVPSDNVLDDNHNVSQTQDSSPQSNDAKILNCVVQLERLDVNKIPPTLKLNKRENSFDDPNTSFVEDVDSNILNDEALFSTKNYENDEDCILQSEYCQSGPGLMDNIMHDAFNIIDHWDSKLFENVSLLEDREILQDKDLMDCITPGQEEASKEEEEVPLTGPLHFTGHKDSIIYLESVGNNFLAASQDGSVYYFDGIHCKLLRVIKVCDLAVTCMSLKRNGPFVFTGSHDGFLRCYNYENGEKVIEDVSTTCGAIQCIFQEWNTLFIGTQTGFVLQYDITTSTVLPDSSIKFSENVILALHAIKEGPRKVLLIASRFQDVTVKDAATGLLLRNFHGPSNTAVYSLLFDSGRVYCGTSSNNVQIFEFATGNMVEVRTGGRGSVCLQIYRGLIFTGCYDGYIYVFSKAVGGEGKYITKISGPGKMLLAMVIVKNKIIVGCKDKSLAIIPLPPEVVSLLDR